MFEANAEGIDELLHGDQAVAFLEQVANIYKPEIERVAPLGSGSVKFRDTISVHVQGGEVAVATDDPFWHLLEYGSVNNPPYRPFTAAAENLGLDFHDTGAP